MRNTIVKIVKLLINGDKIDLALASVWVNPDEMAIDRYFEENGL